MADVFGGLLTRFDALYRRRAHAHHFTRYMDASEFDDARDGIAGVAAQYARLQDLPVPPEAAATMAQILGLPAPGWR